MVNLISKIAIVGVAFIAVLYQFVFKTIIFDSLGIGRSIEPLSTFNNVRCEKVDELGLEGCEDMWLHEPTGFLYMACSNSHNRVQWLPALGYLNASGRGLTDRLAILDTRGSGRLASRIKWVTPENFDGIKGDGSLNLHGLDIRADKHTNTLRILLINHRPTIDPVTGEDLDATKVGANSTVELFQTQAGSDTMRHVRTYANDVIATPNRVAWVNDHAFIFSNDHSGKVGMRRELDALLGGGSIGYCDRNRCNIAQQYGLDKLSTTFSFPNGLVRSSDGLIYVPSAITGEIRVYTLNEHKTLDQIDSIKNPLPIDNLSIDKNGDLFAASFPKMYIWIRSSLKPFEINPPSAVYRIHPIRAKTSKSGTKRTSHTSGAGIEGFSIEKIMEDESGVLPGATIAVHDAQTGRVFLGGAVAPFITVCETR